MKLLRPILAFTAAAALTFPSYIYISIYANSDFILKVPTSPAQHRAYFRTLKVGHGDYPRVGNNPAPQLLTVDTKQETLVIPNNLIVGGAANALNEAIPLNAGVQNAIIGGGGRSNSMDANASNSVIAGGNSNRVFARNAGIGAGYGNRVWQGAEGSTVAGGLNNQTYAPNVAVGGGE
jgi:hypothetical protein